LSPRLVPEEDPRRPDRHDDGAGEGEDGRSGRLEHWNLRW
jgi:hypothetical protein